MSAISDDASVTLILGDYIAADASGKLNVIGGAFSMMLRQPTGNVGPFSIGVIVTVPEKHVPNDYALTIQLFDVTRGKLVQVVGPSGSPEAIRAQQMVTVQAAQLPPGIARPEALAHQHITAMSFPMGLPIEPGTYEWRVEIDAQARPHWRTPFYVLGAAPGPVFGGPANSPTIGGYTYPLSDNGDPSAGSEEP